jgi:hypothetical protein
MLEVAQEGMELLVVLDEGGSVATQPFKMHVRPMVQQMPPRDWGHWNAEEASQGRGQQAATTLGLVMEGGLVMEWGAEEDARRVFEVVAVGVMVVLQ